MLLMLLMLLLMPLTLLLLIPLMPLRLPQTLMMSNAKPRCRLPPREIPGINPSHGLHRCGCDHLPTHEEPIVGASRFAGQSGRGRQCLIGAYSRLARAQDRPRSPSSLAKHEHRPLIVAAAFARDLSLQPLHKLP